jgi:hypothetical protein
MIMGDPTPDEIDAAMLAAAKRIGYLLALKRRAYGPDAILRSPAGPEVGVVIRLHDKMSRLRTLLDDPSAAGTEPMIDTADDLAGYAIILGMLMRGEYR